LVMQSLKEVREFTRGVEERGEWQGEPVEGFVVRCTVGESQEGEPDVVQGESAETGEGSKQKKSNNRESSKLEDEVEKLALWVEDESAHSTSSPDTHTSRPPKPSVTPARTRQLSPPYPSGSTFFFKIKFNQPYLLYRNFREITKLLLPLISSPPGSSTPSLNQPSSSSTKKTKSSKALEIPKSKLQDVDSQAYEFWCRKSMGEHPDWFEGVGRGKGIVAARDRFFEWKAGEEGMRVFKELALEMRKKGKAVAGESRRDRGKDGWGKTMIVPIAVPGCGTFRSSLPLTTCFVV
jgi:tRNA ligase